jgi:hypothetical protein
MGLSRQKVGIAFIATILFIFVVPIPYLASPQWDVVVVRGDNKPVVGVNVRLVYMNYSAEATSHEITYKTDEAGRVSFRVQHNRASVLERAFYITMAATGGVHASFGRHAYVFAFGDGYEGWPTAGEYIMDWQGSPSSVQSTIVLK